MSDVLEVIPPPSMDPAEWVRDTYFRIQDGELRSVLERFGFQLRIAAVQWWAANYPSAAGFYESHAGDRRVAEMTLAAGGTGGEYSQAFLRDMAEYVLDQLGPKAMIAKQSDPMAVELERIVVLRDFEERRGGSVWLRMSPNRAYICGFSVGDAECPQWPPPKE
jgi:hypothetical protein